MVTWKIKGIFKADAQKIYEEINEIGDEYTPQQVVDAARDVNSELHKCFEWDDSIAAEKYRCTQAQAIIRMLVVKPEPSDKVPDPKYVRVIVSQNKDNNCYQPIQITYQNEDEKQLLLDRALRELEAFKSKYGCLKELEGVLEEVEKLLAA